MIKRYVTTASMVCSMVFASGSAFADDTVRISETGADSTQKVIIDNSSKFETSNTNNVHVFNVNEQEAVTGKVEAEKNTSIEGSVGSGNARNENATNTAVSIDNSACDCVVPGSGNGGGNGGNVTPGSGNGSGAGPVSVVTPGSGSVLGASTTVFGSGAGEAVLPEVGAKFPVDVSAMRAAWGQQAPATNLAKGSALFTNFMLITAALLSLLGAAGSVWYAKRREERI
jgi:hypothetical protein